MQSHNFNNHPKKSLFVNQIFGGGGYLPEGDLSGSEQNKNRSMRGPNVTIPEPIITQDKKYKCPIDQAVYDDRKSYEQHCTEEHDVL